MICTKQVASLLKLRRRYGPGQDRGGIGPDKIHAQPPVQLLLLLLLFFEGLHSTDSSYTLHNALKRKVSFTLPQHHQMPGQCAWSSPVRRLWFCVKRSTWSSETALGSCSSCVALIRRGDSSLFVATPEVNPSAPSPDRKVQTSGRTSSNKSAPSTYIVASAKDGK